MPKDGRGALFIQLLSLIKLVEWKRGMARRGRVLCSLVMALNTWQETNWQYTHPPPTPLPLSYWTVKCFSFSHFAFLFTLLASPSKFSYVHPPPKLACLMSNSKVCIFLRLPPGFSIFRDVSVFPRQSDSLRGTFSTLLYLGSSRSELIGRTDAKIVLAPPTPSALSVVLPSRVAEWVIHVNWGMILCS